MPFSPPDEVNRYAARPDTLLSLSPVDGVCEWDVPQGGQLCDTRPRWISVRTGPERRHCYGHGRMWHHRLEASGTP